MLVTSERNRSSTWKQCGKIVGVCSKGFEFSVKACRLKGAIFKSCLRASGEVVLLQKFLTAPAHVFVESAADADLWLHDRSLTKPELAARKRARFRSVVY